MEVVAKYEEIKQKYKDRFLKGEEVEEDKKEDDDEELKEEEIVDVKEI